MSPSLTVYQFPGSIEPQKSEVGGKALSLIKASKNGLPVPPGLVLPVEFFEDWLSQLRAAREWSEFLSQDGNELKNVCDALKARAAELAFNQEQNQVLAKALGKWNDQSLFAVRSSSPQEDLETTSFAGAYETVLGVTRTTLHKAIKEAFASCLDFRIVAYKKHHSLAANDPKIAVVVQEMIASQISGVGFSLNPVSNDYDEVIFNSNWGLGETVVAGIVTPDSFTVDKITGRVKSWSLGSKDTSSWLDAKGNIEAKSNFRSKERTLENAQLKELTVLMKKVESTFGKPIDIEWAYSENQLYLLQARPITTHVALPSILLTPPGIKRRLYIDVTISAQALNKPISVMGASTISVFAQVGPKRVFGSALPQHPDKAPILIAAGRLYLVASNILAIVDKKHFAKFFANMDPLAAQAILHVDYRGYYKPHYNKVVLAKGLLHYLATLGPPVLRAFLRPEQCLADIEREEPRFVNGIDRLNEQQLPLDDYRQFLFSRTFEWIVTYIAPCFLASRVAFEMIKKLCGSEYASEVRHLDQALPRNRTVEMGLALYQLSKLLPQVLAAEDNSDVLNVNSLSVEFGQCWAEFLHKYGHRCAGELDIASTRYRDDPKLLLKQIRTLRSASIESDNPEARYARNRAQREAAYLNLCEKMSRRGGWALSSFKKLYQIWETFGGLRETPKFFLIYAIDQLRTRLLAEADRLVREGKLDMPEQIFDLTLDDLKYQLTNPDVNLRRLGKTNRQPADLLSRAPRLPQVIDSRGLIITAPAPEPKPGEVVGMPISSGVTQGRVKILNSPDEKPFLRGEILVARATDPGWTPLFVNAAAVVLEVGGMLQHGALVAREYGLPCVGGIADATKRWQDGALVEVDGSTGVVRLLNN